MRRIMRPPAPAPWRRVQMGPYCSARRLKSRLRVPGQEYSMRNQLARPITVVGGVRIPFCRANTAYRSSSNQDMMSAVLRGLVQKYGLQNQRLGDVSLGAVIKHSRDFNLARESTLSSGLAPETP